MAIDLGNDEVDKIDNPNCEDFEIFPHQDEIKKLSKMRQKRTKVT